MAVSYKKQSSRKTSLSGYYECLSHDLLLMASGADTHMQTYQCANQSNFKKPGTHGLWLHVPGLKTYHIAEMFDKLGK